MKINYSNPSKVSQITSKHRLLFLQNHPYGMLKKSADMMTGNDRYEGFGIDIIQELSKMLGFNYTFEVQADNVYGSYSKKQKKWTGMLGKIIAGVSNLSIEVIP